MKGTPKVERNLIQIYDTQSTTQKTNDFKKKGWDVIPRAPEGLAVPIPRFSY